MRRSRLRAGLLVVVAIALAGIGYQVSRNVAGARAALARGARHGAAAGGRAAHPELPSREGEERAHGVGDHGGGRAVLREGERHRRARAGAEHLHRRRRAAGVGDGRRGAPRARAARRSSTSVVLTGVGRRCGSTTSSCAPTRPPTTASATSSPPPGAVTITGRDMDVHGAGHGGGRHAAAASACSTTSTPCCGPMPSAS